VLEEIIRKIASAYQKQSNFPEKISFMFVKQGLKYGNS